jgi:phosphomevalonate kinase
MKQTAVEQLGIAFRQWQKDWQNYEETGKNKPVSYDEFIKPFLEMEKQHIVDAFVECWKENMPEGYECKQSAEYYYNETFK